MDGEFEASQGCPTSSKLHLEILSQEKKEGLARWLGG